MDKGTNVRAICNPAVLSICIYNAKTMGVKVKSEFFCTTN